MSIVFDARRSAEKSKRGREARIETARSLRPGAHSADSHSIAQDCDESCVKENPGNSRSARIASSHGSWARDIGFNSVEAAQAPLVRSLLQTPRTRPLGAKHGSNDGLEPATLLVRRNPIYPLIAKEHLISGSVEVHFCISSEGTTYDVKPVKGSPVLAAATIKAVQAWRYEPARLNGVPVDSQASTSFDFSLNSDSSACSVVQRAGQK